VERLVKAAARGRLAAEIDLAPVDGEVLFGVGSVDVVELTVGIGLAREEEAGFLGGDAAAEPAALYLGHVPDKAEQRKRRWRRGALPELVGGQAFAFAQQRLAMKVKPCLEHLPLSGDIGRFLTGDLWRCP
jgi:hypothetical protein